MISPFRFQKKESKALKWDELQSIVMGKNMGELAKIDPNAKDIDFWQETVLHTCAAHCWVNGVRYLMSREPKPNLKVKDTYGGSECYRFVVKSAPNLHFFEVKRFISSELGTKTPKIGSKCSNCLWKMAKR